MGAIGTLDIGDCIATVRHLAALGLTKFGPGQQYLLGGSHGGFIIGHRASYAYLGLNNLAYKFTDSAQQ